MRLTKQNGFGKNLVNSLPNQCTVICAALTIGSHKKWIRKAKIPPKNLLSLTFAEWYSEKRLKKNGVPSAESSRSVRGLGKGVSGQPYPRLCNAGRPRLEPGTFRSQAVRLYRLHQAVRL